jgi:DNA-binding CsgD family transcriptional regulator/N-acetylneuraminic acid mutarotase
MAEFGESLSERELDVLQCVVNGASNKEVAAELSISQNTVKVHLRNVFTKLGVSSRTEATTAALQQGLVSIPGMELVETTTELPPADKVKEEDGATAVSFPPPLPPPTLSPTPSPPAKDPIADMLGRFNWQTALAAAGLGLIMILVILFGRVAVNQSVPTPTPQPFLETAIGQTRWAIARPLVAPLANMAVAAVGLDLFQMGGETAVGVVNRVSRYQTSTHTWQEMTAKPTAVADATAAVLFGEIYVPGGRLADGQPTDVVEAYSPANNAWRPAANLPRPISGGLTLSDGSFLYLFGGWDGQNYLDSAYLYDASSDSWRPLPPLPEAKAFAAGGFVTGQLYVVGGFDGEKALASCHVFEATSNQWSACPEMLAARSGAGSAVLFNKLYVIGGGEEAGRNGRFSEFYDPTVNAWQVVNTPMLEEEPDWQRMGVANVETRIFVLGGRRAGELSDDNFVYTPVIYQTFIPAASAGE